MKYAYISNILDALRRSFTKDSQKMLMCYGHLYIYNTNIILYIEYIYEKNFSLHD
jgi:hypothetical protein